MTTPMIHRWNKFHKIIIKKKEVFYEFTASFTVCQSAFTNIILFFFFHFCSSSIRVWHPSILAMFFYSPTFCSLEKKKKRVAVLLISYAIYESSFQFKEYSPPKLNHKKNDSPFTLLFKGINKKIYHFLIGILLNKYWFDMYVVRPVIIYGIRHVLHDN